MERAGMSGDGRPWLAPLRGALRLALGRADGLMAFRATPEAVLASLAPLLALPLAGAVLTLLGGGVIQAVAIVAFTVTVQLAPLVLSHALARAWGRDAKWLRYAAAFNWCQWAVLAAMLALLVVLRFTGLGMFEAANSPVLLLGVGGYALWLHWVLARHGLGLGRWRAALLVLLVGLGTTALVLGPLLARAVLEVRRGAGG